MFWMFAACSLKKFKTVTKTTKTKNVTHWHWGDNILTAVRYSPCLFLSLNLSQDRPVPVTIFNQENKQVGHQGRNTDDVQFSILYFHLVPLSLLLLITAVDHIPVIAALVGVAVCGVVGLLCVIYWLRWVDYMRKWCGVRCPQGTVCSF